ncbi:hypothetical protein HZA97_04495 [Candidatus Woesearchaeota archaeon]|nr:hypothetical protein [Candidatus Woesearchaeota archaeon]
MGAELGGSYDPGEWKGFDYNSARAAYDPSAGRGYSSSSGSSSKSKKAVDSVPAKLKTDSPSPVIVAVDVTGSMKEWPEVIFEKLPLVDLGLKEYLDNPEISFMAIGDANSDQYGLQVQDFTKGTDLVSKLNKLYIEGGGGGQVQESYELPAVYATHNIEMPNAAKPIFIFIGDEGLYPRVDAGQAEKWAHVTLEKELTTKQAFFDLQKKFSVYCIRKLYNATGSDRMSALDQQLHDQWLQHVGPGHVAILDEPRRVCDVILGIVAQETGNMDHFTQELKDRQTPSQVKTVMKTMKTLHNSEVAPSPTKSKMKSGTKSKKSKDLI